MCSDEVERKRALCGLSSERKPSNASMYKMSDSLSLGGERDIVEHGVGEESLQLGVLVLKRPQPLGLRHIHPAEFGFPGVKRRAADPMLAAHLGGRNPRLLLPQNRNNLLFREL